MDKFITIAITPERTVTDEADIVAALLDGGIDYVHLRHPNIKEVEMRRLIEAIPSRLHGRLRLHSHFALVDAYSLAGAHLNSRNPSFSGTQGTLSRSCHSIKEVADAGKYEYVTLSPVFDSISKQGYNAAISFADFARMRPPTKVIALGGVTPDRFAMLHDAGFAGAAMLGYIWEAQSASELAEKLETIKAKSCFNS